jgi:hypothetical protein
MKIIVSILILSIPYFAAAQFSRGQIYLGGSMTASSTYSDFNSPNSGGPNKGNSFSISPVFGYFLNPNLAVGGSIGYSSSRSEYNYVTSYPDNNNNPITVNAFTKTVTNGITVGSFVRYYVPISSSFYFAAQGQANLTRSNNNTTYFNNGTPLNQEVTHESPSYSVGISIKPVFIFFPSPKWGIEASVGSLGYNYLRYLPDTSSNTTLSFSANQFSFGLAYYFAKKAK